VPLIDDKHKRLFSYNAEEYLDQMRSEDSFREGKSEIAKNLEEIESALNTVKLEAKLYNRLTDLNQAITWNIIIDPYCKESSLKLPYFFAMAESNDLIKLRILIHIEHKKEVELIQGKDYPVFPMLFFNFDGREIRWIPRSEEEISFLKKEKSGRAIDALTKAYKTWFQTEGNQYMQRDLIKLSNDWI
jgi:hypothetical protein